MRLLSMTLHNFKGISDFTLETGGQNAAIYGDNATGKTTLYDAFLWLLFSKDSQNRTDFAVKTLDCGGNELHNLDHEVEAVFEINGRSTTMKKVLKEKWVKKRGSSAPVFDGNTTDYFIDGVPSKAGEYRKHIASIVDEDAFRLLTNPMHFNDNLTWTQRREILMVVCGDITDADVIASDSRLEELPAILGDRSLEDHRKVIMARRTAINKRLEELPARIDEATRALPDLSGLTIREFELRLANFEVELTQKQEELARLNAGGEVAELNRQLAEIQTDLTNIERNIRGDIDEQIQAKRQELNKHRDKGGELKMRAAEFTGHKAYLANEIKSAAAMRDKFREAWHEVNNEVFDVTVTDSCPTCGQSLPAERVQEAHDKALAAFNNDKANRLHEIEKKGKQFKDQQEAMETELAVMEQQVPEVDAKINEWKVTDNQLSAELQALQDNAPDYTQDTRYLAARELHEAIKQQIIGVQNGQAAAVHTARAGIEETREAIKTQQEYLAMFDQADKGQVRIAELVAEQQKLGKEFEELERQLFLADSFTRAKVDMLEARINSRFKLARFKLFTEQINGGLNETCETTYLGVPFSSLNNGMRIAIGLDIISTLSEYYRFSAPVWIDNAEAITNLPKINSQVISMYVSEADRVLRVVPEGQKEREVA